MLLVVALLQPNANPCELGKKEKKCMRVLDKSRQNAI